MSTAQRRSAGPNLLPAEAKQLFRVMNRLRFFVNQKVDLVPVISTLDEFVAADAEDHAVARDALYGHLPPSPILPPPS